MCLYPKLIWNRKYQPNQKNGGNPPKIKDARTGYVPIGCGKCMECKKQKARAWSVRLQEEIRTARNAKFVTLTFSNESIKELNEAIKEDGIRLEGYDLDNKIAKVGIRRFLERWRKEYKVSLRHWFASELGGNGTENIHLHGIIWTDEERNTVEKIWKYGWIYPDRRDGWKRNYVNEATINYCVKYTTKTDKKHEYYNPIILTSPGIGANYTNRSDAKTNRYKEQGETDESYTTRQGRKMNMPTYWRNKIYSEEQREKLWIQKLDKQERWVDGVKVSTATEEGREIYYQMVRYARIKSKKLGYADDETNWEKEEYEHNRRKANMRKRLGEFDNSENIDNFEHE